MDIMQNRAKCKLCGDILQSYHRHDYVKCSCGEISIDGGLDYLHCSAKNWENFLRIDDEGNEIVVKVIDEKDQNPKKDDEKGDTKRKLSRKELISMLETMVKNIENLPKHVMDQPINHYDFYSYMLLVVSILKTSRKD